MPKTFEVTETADTITVTAYGEARTFPASQIVTHTYAEGITRLLWVETAVVFATGKKVHAGRTMLAWSEKAPQWREAGTYAKNRNGLRPVGWFNTYAHDQKTAHHISQHAAEASKLRQ